MEEVKLRPLALARYAKEHLEAYTALKEAKKGHLELCNIKYFLLCRSLELSLKSELLRRGVATAGELKTKFRHDLVTLRDTAINIPTVTFNSEENAIIDALNPYYKDKEFEYPVVGFKTFPVLDDVEQLCSRLIWF